MLYKGFVIHVRRCHDGRYRAYLSRDDKRSKLAKSNFVLRLACEIAARKAIDLAGESLARYLA